MTQITPMAESLKWAMCFTNHWTKLSNESVPKNKSYTSFAYDHVKIYSTKAVGWINEHFHKAILSDVSLCLFHHLYHERAASLYGWLLKVYVSPMGQTWWPSKLGGTFVVINSHSWGAVGEEIQKSGLLFGAFSSHGKGTYSVPFFPLSVIVMSNKTNLLHSVSEALFQAHLSSRV